VSEAARRGRTSKLPESWDDTTVDTSTAEVGSSSAGLRQVAEASLAGGIDLEAYAAWQRDREAGGRMFGRIDVAEHLGARLTHRSGAYCSLWLDGTPLALPRLVARYLETYATLLGPI